MWSDSCASQFRYPFAFELLENHHKDVIINWHYNEGHHGNSPMDGIGDTIKIWCSGALKSGKVMINSPKEFCDAANQFASSISTLFQKEKLLNFFFFFSNGKESCFMQKYLTAKKRGHTERDFESLEMFCTYCISRHLEEISLEICWDANLYVMISWRLLTVVDVLYILCSKTARQRICIIEYF